MLVNQSMARRVVGCAAAVLLAGCAGSPVEPAPPDPVPAVVDAPVLLTPPQGQDDAEEAFAEQVSAHLSGREWSGLVADVRYDSGTSWVWFAIPGTCPSMDMVDQMGAAVLASTTMEQVELVVVELASGDQLVVDRSVLR